MLVAKKIGTILTFLCLAFLASCGYVQERVDASAYEQIHRKLISMESFVAQATVQYIANNNTHTYDTVQLAKTSGEYRIEVIGPEAVAGNVTVFDGTTISQFNPNIAGRLSQTTIESPERVEILLTSFVRNFIRSQEVSIAAATIDNSLTTLLEASIPGDHPYLSTARLWVSNESLLPLRMAISDASGQERIIVEYHFFEYNVDIGDEFFLIP